MSGIMVFQSLAEIAAVALIVLGFFNEGKLAALEEKLFTKLRRRFFKVVKGGEKFNKHCA